ncbi:MULTISPECIES: ribosome biogenesis GTPase YlqF [unclassified Clostridioides]|uniref:ribosome biogenesis GTPase YlqF n=1 Tax=unclassified Clostridioides TaxID=2635829 RepID=UPI001D0C9D30|nr:ribosome biogenesis GTPase YlqF [Clostridioides sp. ES-S-0001-03]MCC0678823.1 ribosome biogenesis GTPase YlqF [Clostridioides sp. ES-S-0005-03]MCC0703316.1 ribosome biogenesis GTPase YlqF [Clostridioides sp. ES-S-0049-02]MCC0763117.1 ribosome biogenesis GTPase YlqF [Clostridioides sp. ES-S-0006-03]UDN48640.1 ribosome biogenesis GTPase YlqF [Clostridioides sp. ES-S-0173-01]UDN57366.1 ribosome biogenesis GTPase YlqF [Clostridioides sp. ES-S-0010-02]UDN63041.1 ribosome biogenesis GTPase YlqF 
MSNEYEEYLMDNNLHINWYPGHMKKTKELVKNNLKLIDVVVELLDARIPFSSKNPDIDMLVGDKPRVVVLNKSDMADRDKLNQWIEYYKKNNIKAIPVDTLKGVGVNKIVEECKNVTREKMSSLKDKGRKERAIRIMIVGVPNVGKSSLINKLTGRKSTQTGDKPGVTKGKQWVRLKGNLELLDTPGILWPKFEDQEVALNLAFSRAIKDEILDVETLALRLIEKLMIIEPEKLKARYKLDSLGETPIETMDMIGHKRGFITGGKELDYTRIAVTVLNEFRDGKIGNITLEVPESVKR